MTSVWVIEHVFDGGSHEVVAVAATLELAKASQGTRRWLYVEHKGAWYSDGALVYWSIKEIRMIT